MVEETLLLNGERLTIDNVVQVAREHRPVDFEQTSLEKMRRSREMLEAWIKDEKVVYGITTGFGPFVSTLIPSKFQTQLQENLIRSHAAQAGPLFSQEETRAAMLLRLNAFAKGLSAIGLGTADLLRQMLNVGIHPCVPQWGSVGASGDLNPSAHIALALMGEGRVEYKGEIMEARQALEAAGLAPVVFRAKEGLALINGTTMMTSVGALQVHDAWNLIKTAEIISVLALEALMGSAEPLLQEAHEAKPHPGQIRTAANLRAMLKGTGLVWDGLVLQRLQDGLQAQLKTAGDVVRSGVQIQNAYSLRAIPQILGAVRDALDYITARITTEINSANDNPLFFPDLGISHQGGNFHGQSVALPLDVLAIALTEIAVLSERQLNRLLDRARSGGLSPFLAGSQAGLRCGFEGVQYLATSLVAECRTLCNPVSIQSIPSNEENQDVVSMGLIAARKARDIKERVEHVLAVELLAACQALEEREKEKMGHVSRAVYNFVREHVSAYDEDRFMGREVEEVQNLIHNGILVEITSDLFSH